MPFAGLGPQKRIWYEINGQGEPLVQIPGGALGLRNFSRVSPVLARHFRVVDFDPVGTGKSSPTPRGYTIQDWSDDFRDLLDMLEIPRAHLHGTSTGGHTCLQFAAQHPERVMKMVLVGVVARYDTAMRLNRKVAKALARSVGMEAVAELTAQAVLTRDFLDSPEAGPLLEQMRSIFGEISPDSYIATIEASEKAELGPDLPRVTAPTLVINGEHSTFSPVDTGPQGIGGRGIAQQVRNGRLVVIKGAGHLVMMERFEEVCDNIIEFLKE
jgi:pimeloyl-ACP methyl ester carboxylesterase